MRQILHCLTSHAEWMKNSYDVTLSTYFLFIMHWCRGHQVLSPHFVFFSLKLFIFRLCNSDSHMVFCSTFIISVVLHWVFQYFINVLCVLRDSAVSSTPLPAMPREEIRDTILHITPKQLLLGIFGAKLKESF